MTRSRLVLALPCWLWPLSWGWRWWGVFGLCCAASAFAQTSDAPGPVGGVPAQLPPLALPTLNDVNLPLPRPVRAATAALGMGRQRLALVVGIGTVGKQRVVDNASRDTQAVAAALRAGGYVVMLREDLSAADLRQSLNEFRERLQPGGMGFIYATGLGAQLDGQSLLLAREAVLDAQAAPAARAAQLRQAGVPLTDLVNALIGTPDSPRLLVVDAAYRHPALSPLPQAGLAEPRLPPGMMALFSHPLGEVQDVPAVAPLPIPAPTDPREIAASRFAVAFTRSITTPRVNGPEALRATRRSLEESSLGLGSPWLGGDTDAREEFAEATLLDGLVPRSPEEIAREGARQLLRLSSRTAGEQTVAQVLQQSVAAPAAASADAPSSEGVRRAAPETPGSSLVTQTVGAVGTVVGVAGTVAAVAVSARVAEATASVAAASTAVSAATTAGSIAVSAVSIAARVLGSGEEPVPPVAPPTLAAIAPAAAVPAPAPVLPAPVPAAPAAPLNPAMPVAMPQAVPSGGDAGRRLGQAVASTLARQALAESGNPQANNPAALRQPAATDGRTTRQADGGERPVYTPRTNSFGYAEGDTFTYRVTDTWKGQVSSEYTTAIEEVMGDGQLHANGQQMQMDPQGRITRQLQVDGTLSQFEPYQDLWWSNPKRGQSRDLKFLEKFTRADRVQGQTEWKGSTSVGRPRKIELPAGEFEVLPIESDGWWYQTLSNGTRDSGKWYRTVWYSPKLGHPVAIDIEDVDRLGKLLKRERVELLHAQSARAMP